MMTWFDISPGIRRRTIASGPRLYQMYVELKKGAHMPPHKHHHEQIVHLVKGHVNLNVEGKPIEMKTGDSYLLEGNVSHGVDVLEDSIIIDTFNPPREDLIEQDRKFASAIA